MSPDAYSYRLINNNYPTISHGIISKFLMIHKDHNLNRLGISIDTPKDHYLDGRVYRLRSLKKFWDDINHILSGKITIKTKRGRNQYLGSIINLFQILFNSMQITVIHASKHRFASGWQ